MQKCLTEFIQKNTDGREATFLKDVEKILVENEIVRLVDLAWLRVKLRRLCLLFFIVKEECDAQTIQETVKDGETPKLTAG